MLAPAFTSGLTREALPLGIANFTYPRGDVATASVAPTLPLVAPLVLIFQGCISEELT
jgi:hypothetical protein